MYETETEDYASLMEEAPGGENHGRMNGNDLGTDESVVLDFRFGGGWGVVGPGEGGTRGNPGGNVLHPDEYVDIDKLRTLALEEFGYTAEQVDRVYSVKRIVKADSQLRAEMDARMLALRASGANMFQFAEAIGLNQRTMGRALARAEAAS